VSWYVYVARCRDDTLYCGIARDVAARIAEHDAGTGARYTRGRGPLTVVLVRRCRDRSGALRLEHAIKQLPTAHKVARFSEVVARRQRRRAAPAARGATSARGCGPAR